MTPTRRAGRQPRRARLTVAVVACAVLVAGPRLSAPASAAPLFKDYVIVETMSVPAATASGAGVNEAMADCTPGDVALGGGAEEGTLSTNILISSDGPLIGKAELRTFSITANEFNLHLPADGWEVEGDNYTSAAAPLTAYAVCQPPTGGGVGATTVVASFSEGLGGPPSVSNQPATCPSGQQATGGGADIDPPLNAIIEGTAPLLGASNQPYGWSVQFQGLNSLNVGEYTGVICAQQKGLASLDVISATNADASCAVGSEATGGGLAPPGLATDQLLDTLPLVGGSLPTTGTGPVTGWRATDDAIGFTVDAVCASLSGTAPSTTTTSPPGSAPSPTGGSSLKPVTRLAGTDRIATAIAVSQASFPGAGSAKAVVLARSDDFADALAGTPLAIAKGAPLLLTRPGALDPRVQGEILRVASVGTTVYLLGGPAALAPSIESAISGLGDTPQRLAGADRFATATAIAHTGLGDPTKVLEATGLNFPDALSAGAAAGAIGAAVLLTNDGTQAPATAAYLNAHPGDVRWAVGGQAAAADPDATPLAGSDRFATSADVAAAFFPTAPVIGAALGTAFPDALPGGAHVGALHGPLLLVEPNTPIAPSVLAYLTTAGATVTAGFLYGGVAVVSDTVRTAIAEAIS